MNNENLQPTTDGLRKYIQGELINDTTTPIEDDDDLLLSGLLDSLNVVRLASFMEQTYEFSIPPEDMVVENFGSLNQIVAYVANRV